MLDPLGARFVEVRVLDPVFEKLATELKHEQKLLQCKSTVDIPTLNVKALI